MQEPHPERPEPASHLSGEADQAKDRAERDHPKDLANEQRLHHVDVADRQPEDQRECPCRGDVLGVDDQEDCGALHHEEDARQQPFIDAIREHANHQPGDNAAGGGHADRESRLIARTEPLFEKRHLVDDVTSLGDEGEQEGDEDPPESERAERL